MQHVFVDLLAYIDALTSLHYDNHRDAQHQLVNNWCYLCSRTLWLLPNTFIPGFEKGHKITLLSL